MNLTDLTEVLRDRAALADSAHEARMAGVRAKVAAARRRRAVAGVAAVVLALVGIVYAVLPRPDRLPEPAEPPRSMTEYQYGTRIIAQAWADLPSTAVTLRFVPKSLDLMIFTRCETGPEDRLLFSTTVNGHPMAERNTCGGASRPLDWTGLDVVPGQPSIITLTVDGKQSFDETGELRVLPLPANGTFAIGIGEAVPVSEYPFPPRPQTLPAFPPTHPTPVVELKSDAADPNARREFTVPWPGDNVMVAQMNAPGRMRVLVDDVQIVDHSNWSYGVGGEQVEPREWKQTFGLDIAQGRTVKITVVPERSTGEWRVTLGLR
ncbi:hypothetical protein [Lentzea sp. CC55]|uniref:hypothetical protein n=1 Tax=Lentzea sp. CC55 TaxID=2884909 RepID=UPI001F2EE24D|nr:hypothetical protein [Lentzea sp. CC55]MCG8927769.1 hypothetical protein [Lentzea sp. CC55]